MLREAAALLWQGTAKVRDDAQESSQAHASGPACTTRLSPLSILRCIRKLGIHVLKDMYLPREVSHVPLILMAESRATCSDRMGEVSSRHSSWWKRAPQRGEVSPQRRPERCPARMVWVNDNDK